MKEQEPVEMNENENATVEVVDDKVRIVYGNSDGAAALYASFLAAAISVIT